MPPLHSAAALLAVSALAASDFDGRFEEIRRTASPQEMYAFFWDMPKGGDIHHHLSLSFRPEEVYQTASNFYTRVKLTACPGGSEDSAPPLRYRMVSPANYALLSACEQGDYVQIGKLDGEQKAAWASSLIIDRAYEGRNEFFEVIVNRVTDVARNPEVMLQLLTRLLQRYARENILYLETQYLAPSDEVAAKFRSRLAEPDLASLPTKVRFQAVIVRFRPDAEQLLERAYAFVDRNRDLWVGVNMAGREDNTKGNALRFLPVFRKLRRTYSGIHLSIHGGEVDAPGPEVRNTLLLGAERIGHGFNLITDPETMLQMRRGRNLVEVNLVSNRLLEYSPDLDAHPFIEYLRFGIPVCLNTDDSGVWDSNLTDEYVLASRHYRLTWSEIVQLGRNSLEHSFAQPDLKERLLREFEGKVRAFETRYSAPSWKDQLKSVHPEVSGYARRSGLVRD
jgi:adenosine deaminase CECR1